MTARIPTEREWAVELLATRARQPLTQQINTPPALLPRYGGGLAYGDDDLPYSHLPRPGIEWREVAANVFVALVIAGIFGELIYRFARGVWLR